MTASEMARIDALYREIERRLERDSDDPEIERLYAEVMRLVPAGEDVWLNLDPRGVISRSSAA